MNDFEEEATVLPLAVVCDLPARSELTGIKYFSGYHSCFFCKQRGKRLNNSMYWPYFELEEDDRRTHEELLENYENKSNGIVRDSPLLIIKEIVDLSRIVAIDYMHQHCEGILYY